jgi:hypothetical protein
MRIFNTKLITTSIAVITCFAIFAQDGRVNTVTTAVPFLRVNPDGRTAAMGDAGIAASPDGNSVFLNPSRMAFIDSDYGVSLNFVPWLRGLTNDVYMASIVGYVKIKDQQTITSSLRYFSLGNIQFTNQIGTNTGEGNPREFALDFTYARKLSENFSLAAGMRYIYSNLSATQVPDGGVSINPGHAVGADISLMYSKPINTKNMEAARFNFGTAITNIGSKMTYTGNAQQKDFIPTNLGIGFGGEMDIDKFNSINVYFDINKLMVPTPETTDSNNSGIPDYKERSSVGGMFSSFGDAPGGFSEELKEYMFSVGAEYVYNKIFAVRAGYFYEAATKGDRRYLQAGMGLTYSVATINFAYVIPTSRQRTPLDNTMRFSILFDFAKGGAKTATQEPTPID